MHQVKPRDESCVNHVDRIQSLFEKTSTSGQQSERNLVNAINDFAPFDIKLGTEKYKIVSSKQLGGGNPEPKADISITTSTGKEIGISMKKPNFGFFENWMNENKLRLLLKSVNIEGPPQDLLVKELKDEAETMSKTATFKNAVKKEYDAMLELVPAGEVQRIKSLTKDGRKFKVNSLSIPKYNRAIITNALVDDPKNRFGATKLKSSFKVNNVYKSLKQILGENYNNFLKNVIGGSSNNKYPAEYIIVETINKGIDLNQTIKALENSTTVDDTVKKYEDDDKINIKFRLRPISITRACYSSTNQGKYKKGSEFYFDDTIGVSWTVFVSR
tara:strand:+ start:58 stop:1047 length:990 start_codon:yes stop_codon:yes gene_type:complete